jgi:hypothetical protein
VIRQQIEKPALVDARTIDIRRTGRSGRCIWDYTTGAKKATPAKNPMISEKILIAQSFSLWIIR